MLDGRNRSVGSRHRGWIPAAIAVFVLVVASPALAQDKKAPEGDPHAQVYKESDFPSAAQCAPCHQQIYDEWKISSHAYGSISPMFHKFEQAINDLAPTIGHFCVRCHASVGTALGEQRDLPLWKRSQVSREGITCITCHRVAESFGKVNGERVIEAGDIHKPMYGNQGAATGLKEVIDNKSFYKVATEPSERGMKIHNDAIKFETLSKSEFCVSCHQVAVNLGIKLEVVWDQYRASPAFKQGVSCQDCHMSKQQGVNAGYAIGPAAVINGQAINPGRKHANHSFAGPGYPIAHPGIFPHNTDAQQWTIDQWLLFDYRAKWGSEEFEEKVEKGQVKVNFPEAWSDRIDREEAWAVVEANFKGLEKKAQLRKEVMEAGGRIDGPFLKSDLKAGQSLKFAYRVTNTNPGHNLPSGSLGAQPEIWLNVALIDPDGKNVWESGYVDSIGDMADLHSLDVAAGKIAHDDQLFNLQTKFLTMNVKGTDREMYLPVNFDADQLPMLRPPAQPVTVMNHPPFVRMEARSITPLSYRDASYSVPGNLLARPGKYRLAVRMRSRAEPMYFMRFVGATVDMEQAMNEWMLDIHPYTVEFEVK
ncbi:MAG: cytochrome C [Alphaproteobacteria bacterium]|nr:cytochrome C [Alphaproteobacteria bacterium]